MTQKAGTPPDGGAARLLIGLPLGLLIAFAIASMIGWLILGLPVAAYDPLKMLVDVVVQTKKTDGEFHVTEIYFDPEGRHAA